MLAQAGSMLALASAPGFAATGPEFPFPGGNGARSLAKDFPQKGSMVLQRSRPPLLETPFTDFDSGVFTPNEKFFVRWHWSVIPTEIDPATYRLKVHGQVERELSLSLSELAQFERVEIAAVNQCSGNSGVSSNHAFPVRNGAMAAWAMPAGRACGSAMCWTRPA